MEDSFINKLKESFTITNNDFTVFDVLDNSSGISNFYTKKVSYKTLTNKISSDLIPILNDKINQIQSTLNNSTIEIENKLDKNGTNYSKNEKIIGPLVIDSQLSANGLSFFRQNIDLTYNKIINLNNPESDYDASNRKYVNEKFDSIVIPDLSNYIMKSGDLIFGNLILTQTPLLSNHIIHKKYVDDLSPINKYLPLSGGSMVGNLSVLTPTNDFHAVTKKYADDLSPFGRFLPLSGGTLTNNISVNDPTNLQHITNKKYVDNKLSLYLPLNGGTMLGNLNVNTPTEPSHAASKSYIDNFPFSNTYLPLSGGKMNGYLSVNDPTNDFHAVTKKYVDNLSPGGKFVSLSGDTMTGYLSVLEPTQLNHPATKKYVDDKIPVGSFLPLSGGSMTGYLSVLPPTLDNHAVTKSYVDNKGSFGSYVPLAGGTMIGYLNVLTPTLSNHAVTKEYVDSKSPSNSYVPLSGGIMTGLLSLKEINYPILSYNNTIDDTIINMTGNVIFLTLNNNVSHFNYGLPPNNYTRQIIIFIQQKGTSTFYNIKNWKIGNKDIIWYNSDIPIITQQTNKIDIFKFIYTNNNWYGSIIGQNF
jgi:hypothetical protein